MGDAITRYKDDPDGLQLVAAALDTAGDRDGAKLAFAALLKLEGPTKEYSRAYGAWLWSKGHHLQALTAWTASLGSQPTALDYEHWVEILLSEEVLKERSLRAAVSAEVKRGLARYPRHPRLLGLARRHGL